MKRRNFIKLSASVSALSLFPHEIKAMLKSSKLLENCDYSGRRLVLINLSGGNDGLNTIVPINQYDIYKNLRPTIGLPNTGANAFINLDNTLSLGDQVGLNPALTGFKDLYDKGWMRMVQGVGYPTQNKSHFASTDIYMTGNDGNSFDNGKDSGWIGRFMEKNYAMELGGNYPLAVQIGSLKNSLGLHGEEEHGMAVNLTNQDPSGFYSILNGLGGQAPTTFPSSDFGTELKYIVDTDKLANIYAGSVSDAFNKGVNQGTFPDTDIANQLKTVSRLIKGGLKSKVYMVQLSGFDTHNDQVDTSVDSVQGRHHDLLTKLGDAVKAFNEDLELMGIADDVVSVTFSEFGRKAKENGSFGTDHGEIAPLFVFGKSVQGGVSGINPNLLEAEDDNNYQVQSVQYDYRQVFGTLLQDYMGAGDAIIDEAFFNNTATDSFVNTKISEILKPEKIVSRDCLTVVESTTNESISSFSVSPNPFVESITIRYDDDSSEINVDLFSQSGRTIDSYRILISNGSFNLNLKNLKSGVYFLKISADNKVRETIKIVKI